jgi:hypothetical protein
VLFDEYPVLVVHLFQAKLFLRGQFVIHHHRDIKMVVRNAKGGELRLVGNARYHGEIKRACDDLPSQFIGIIAPELYPHLREKREMDGQQCRDKHRLRIGRFADINNSVGLLITARADKTVRSA